MGENRRRRRYQRLLRSNPEVDVQDELETHIALRVEDLLRQGQPEAEARAQAKREFGDMVRIRRDMSELGRKRRRRERRAWWWASLGQDVRYALRLVRTSPGFASMVILTLALGIGANTAIFSMVNAVLLRPLPFPEPERLIDVNTVFGDLEEAVSAPAYREYKETVTRLEGLAAYSGWAANLTEVGSPEFVMAARVSANYHSVVGVAPALGRDFGEGDDEPGADRVVLVSDGFWTRRLGSSRDVLGTTIRLNGEAYEIVGVMPRDYVDFYNAEVELWVPLVFTPQQLAGSWTNDWLRTIGRLRPGGSILSLNAELDALAAQLRVAENLPDEWSVRAKPLRELGRADVQRALWVLLGAVGLVLLIACANVANLSLARASVRAKEIAIRAALGAGRRRIAGQLLTESVVLSLTGGALGLAFAEVAVRVLPAALPALERIGAPLALHRTLLATDIGLDGTVLAFAASLAVGTGLVFGLVPALQLMRADAQQTLCEGGRSGRADGSGSWLRRTLVAGEIALAITLLTGAGLLVRSFAKLQSVDPGFEPAGVLTFYLFLPAAQYPTDAARIAFFDRSLEAVRAVLGVESAAAINMLPFGGGWSTANFSVEGHAASPGEQSAPGTWGQPWGDFRVVSPGYFETMRIPLLRGRTFEERDRGGPPVAVIDALLGQRYFAGRDPIGLHIKPANPEEPRYRIIGVVGHAAHEGLDAEPRVQLYRTYDRLNPEALAVVVRTRRRPALLVSAVRAAVQSVDPAMPLAYVAEMESLVSGSVGERRASTVLLTSFALLALLLACLGIYGVMSYVVTQRRQEIGVRIALGARAESVVRLFLWQGSALVAAGLAFGIAGAFALTRVLRSQLFGVEPTDPAAFVAATLVLIGTALLATWLPARRAARMDPVRALRDE